MSIYHQQNAFLVRLEELPAAWGPDHVARREFQKLYAQCYDLMKYMLHLQADRNCGDQIFLAISLVTDQGIGFARKLPPPVTIPTSRRHLSSRRFHMSSIFVTRKRKIWHLSSAQKSRTIF